MHLEILILLQQPPRHHRDIPPLLFVGTIMRRKRNKSGQYPDVSILGVDYPFDWITSLACRHCAAAVQPST